MSGQGDAKKAWVERVLGYEFSAAAVGNGAARTHKFSVRLTETLLTWNRTRSYVGWQIIKLQQEILVQTQDATRPPRLGSRAQPQPDHV
jgi:hypothetical protein